MNRNKLLFFAVIVIVIAAISLMLKVASSNEEKEQRIKPIPEKHTEVSGVERDTYVNTISTMSQRLLEADKKYNDLEQRLNTLEKPKPLDQSNNSRVKALVSKEVDEKTKSIFDGYAKRIDQLLSTKTNNRGDKKTYQIKDSFNKNDIPSGLGFDSLLNPAGKNSEPNNQLTANELQTYQNDQLVTIKPFTQIAYSNDDNDPVKVDILGHPIRLIDEEEASDLSIKKEAKGKKIPFYTIPRNATLFSNTTLTALLGIVPNNEGSVLDPIRFKLITGPENLASNGHFIPGIRDIVWSGIAIGNREMSCVRGEVHSVTFTFDDGRIYTQSSTRDGNTKTTNIRKILGYISDTKGTPCLTGQLITNATDYLQDRMIASGVGATASSLAAAQETTSTSAAGGSTTFLTGNEVDFIAASTIAGSLGELTDYLRERARNAVDLVYLDSGQDVVLHIEDEITIDYYTKGRKLDYASKIPSSKKSSIRYFD